MNPKIKKSSKSQPKKQTSMKKTTTQISTVSPHKLFLHPFLGKYGICKPTDFEISQLSKYDLKPGQVIATDDKKVIYNWEGVLQAKQLKLKEIEVVTISGLSEDEVIQITSFKNIRKKLSRKQTAELIVDLREHLTENPTGIKWKEDIPGNKTDEKIAFLLDCSYGTVFSLHDIYKYDTSLLDKIDADELSLTEALEEIQKIKNKLKSKDERNDSEEGNEGEPTNELSPTNGTPKTPKVNEQNEHNTETAINEKWRYAGEKQMVECEAIASITVRYVSGRTEELKITNKTACLSSNPVEVLKYNGGRFHPRDNSSFHCFTNTNGRTGIEFITWNIEKKAA